MTVFSTAVVVAASPGNTSGSDIHGIVRRAVVVGDGAQVSTASLFAEVGSGPYRASIPEEMYL